MATIIFWLNTGKNKTPFVAFYNQPLQPRCRPHSDEHLSAAPPLSWVDRGHQRAIPPRASQRRIFPPRYQNIHTCGVTNMQGKYCTLEELRRGIGAIFIKG